LGTAEINECRPPRGIVAYPLVVLYKLYRRPPPAPKLDDRVKSRIGFANTARDKAWYRSCRGSPRRDLAIVVLARIWGYSRLSLEHQVGAENIDSGARHMTASSARDFLKVGVGSVKTGPTVLAAVAEEGRRYCPWSERMIGARCPKGSRVGSQDSRVFSRCC